MTSKNAFQLSTLSAVMLGNYEPALTIGELKTHGTLGIGTFEGIGGELILIDGKAFNGSYSSEAVPVDDAEKTPFACVIPWAPDDEAPIEIPGAESLEGLRAALEAAAAGKSKNRILAVRMKASDVKLKFRSFAPAFLLFWFFNCV